MKNEKRARQPVDPITFKMQAEPDGEGGYLMTDWRRTRVPSVVMRADGRYGVAYPKHGLPPRAVCLFDTNPALYDMSHRQVDAALGRTTVDTTGTSGWFHEPQTHASRGEAQKRAWAAARELGGDISDWP